MCGGGDWFLEDPYVEQAERFTDWVGRKQRRLLALEIGSGFNTPGVIRWPMERIAYARPGAFLVRVNLKWPQVPGEIADRSLSLRCSAMSAVTAFWEAMRGPRGEG